MGKLMNSLYLATSSFSLASSRYSKASSCNATFDYLHSFPACSIAASASDADCVGRVNKVTAPQEYCHCHFKTRAVAIMQLALQAGKLIGEQLGKLWAGHGQAGHLDVDLDECATAQLFARCVLADRKVAIGIALPQPLLIVIVLAHHLLRQV